MDTLPDFTSELLAFAQQGSRAMALKNPQQYRDRLDALVAWTKGLPETAVAQLTDILFSPQEEPFGEDEEGDPLHRVAVEALAFLGDRYPAAVEAALAQLLGQPATAGLALLAIANWADTRMLPALAALIDTSPPQELGFLISNALCGIEGEEAIALLERLLEMFEDDPELSEHIQEAIWAIED
jgi:hypothetical protein